MLQTVPTDSSPLLVDSREAARLLCICERSLWKLTDDGAIPCIRMGRAKRYHLETLRQWVRDQQTSGTDQPA